VSTGVPRGGFGLYFFDSVVPKCLPCYLLFILVEDFGSNFSLFVLVSFFGIFEDVNEMLGLGKVSRARHLTAVNTTYCADDLARLVDY